MPQFIGPHAVVEDSLINQGSIILGKVVESIISNEVYVAKGAVIEKSVLMPGVRIGENAHIHNAILGPNTQIKDNEVINENSDEVVLVDYERNLQNWTMF